MRRTMVAVLVLGSALVGLAVGWLVIGSGGIDADTVDVLVGAGTLATAVATVGLGAATVYLGVKTREVVSATQDEAQAAREDLAIAREQADVSRAALDAETAPMLTNVPWGLARVPSLRQPAQVFGVGAGLSAEGVVQTRDAAVVGASVTQGGDTSQVSIRLPLRIVGNGAAHVRTVQFILSGNTGFSGTTTSPIVPPGEMTTATLIVAATSPDYEEAVAAIENPTNFSIVIAYGDVSGRPRGAVRFDVYHREGPFPWHARQVHWASTAEEVIERPAFGSQPLD